jgi:hypothetical protein
MVEPIASFEGAVVRVKTMADGSPRFEFEAPEQAISQMQVLAEAQAERRYLRVIVLDADKWNEYERNL